MEGGVPPESALGRADTGLTCGSGPTSGLAPCSYGGYNACNMTRVGTRELKNRLSHYLRLVRAGARVVITDHGRPVAEITSVAAAGEDREQAWLRAATRGQVTLPKRSGFARHRPVRLRKGARLSDAVDEGRE